MSSNGDVPLVSLYHSPQLGNKDLHKGCPGIEAPVSFRARDSEEVEIEYRTLAELGVWGRSGTSFGVRFMKRSRGLSIQTFRYPGSSAWSI